MWPSPTSAACGAGQDAARERPTASPAKPIAGKVGYISSVAEFTPKTVQTEELRSSLVYEIRVMVDDPARPAAARHAGHCAAPTVARHRGRT